jgi:hypothetical protein
MHWLWAHVRSKNSADKVGGNIFSIIIPPSCLLHLLTETNRCHRDARLKMASFTLPSVTVKFADATESCVAEFASSVCRFWIDLTGKLLLWANKQHSKPGSIYPPAPQKQWIVDTVPSYPCIPHCVSPSSTIAAFCRPVDALGDNGWRSTLKWEHGFLNLTQSCFIDVDVHFPCCIDR